MDTSDIIRVLNRLLHTICRSLPMYLDEARPWTCRDDEEMETALRNLVADQRLMAEQLTSAIVEQGGRPSPGRFPTRFTAANDLSLDFLRKLLIEHQRCDVEAVRRCVSDLSAAPVMKELAEEALGNAQGHLEILDGIDRGWVTNGEPQVTVENDE